VHWESHFKIIKGIYFFKMAYLKLIFSELVFPDEGFFALAGGFPGFPKSDKRGEGTSGLFDTSPIIICVGVGALIAFYF
jgi:hypothetical protein